MMPRMVGLVVAFCICGVAVAQSENPLIPKKPLRVSLEDIAVLKIVQVDSKPVFAIAKFIQNEKALTPQAIEVTFVQEKRTQKVTIDGKEVEREYTVQIPVTNRVSASTKNFLPTPQDRLCPVQDAQVFDVHGKVVERELWPKLFEKPRHVLLLKEPIGEDNPLDPFYMSVIREDTLLVFLPKQAVDSTQEKKE